MSQLAQKIFFWSSSLKRSTPRSSLAGSDIAKSGIGKLDRETGTQGAVGQAEHIALFKTPRFIVNFGDTGVFMFLLFHYIILFKVLAVAKFVAQEQSLRTIVAAGPSVGDTLVDFISMEACSEDTRTTDGSKEGEQSQLENEFNDEENGMPLDTRSSLVV
ncbi:hypothetical protein O0I10_008773 [Lichtheimia ornata]|uniref:Uncharacterized protein n=1 Tax=Lichtheimia ornata TaxID=688661 RepID=A0AAD7UZD2_9FUNG|nr:uncharacterized protein O0I10_008773 [Lichtheimia ornata]KAJ8655487.1 hypothetical protein O0I10_008773 [Lichtheimia ornata]